MSGISLSRHYDLSATYKELRWTARQGFATNHLRCAEQAGSQTTYERARSDNR